MKLIAIRQLVGDYGRVDAGQTFEASADIAEQLLARGLVRHALPPRIAYEICNGKFIPGPAWPAVESERK
jgi:hypothetical protein